MTITLRDEREDPVREVEFHAKGGLREMVQFLNANRKPLHAEVVYIETERDGIGIELAMQYNDGYAESVFSFVNNINTHEGGTHLTGFKAALTRVVNQYVQKSNLNKKDKETVLTGDDAREGLAAVLSVKVREPQFEGQTKTKLGNSEVEGVRRAVHELRCNTSTSTEGRATSSSTRRSARPAPRGRAQGALSHPQEERA